MNVVNKLPLLGAALLLPEQLAAHPGHAHTAGLLESVQHAIIGWDQLSLLLLAGVAGLLVYLTRPKQ